MLILFGATDKTLSQRRTDRGLDDYYENLPVGFHQRTNKGYEEGKDWIKKNDFVKKLVVVNADRTIKKIAADVGVEIEKLL